MPVRRARLRGRSDAGVSHNRFATGGDLPAGRERPSRSDTARPDRSIDKVENLTDYCDNGITLGSVQGST